MCNRVKLLCVHMLTNKTHSISCLINKPYLALVQEWKSSESWEQQTTKFSSCCSLCVEDWPLPFKCFRATEFYCQQSSKRISKTLTLLFFLAQHNPSSHLVTALHWHLDKLGASSLSLESGKQNGRGLQYLHINFPVMLVSKHQYLTRVTLHHSVSDQL